MRSAFQNCGKMYKIRISQGRHRLISSASKFTPSLAIVFILVISTNVNCVSGQNFPELPVESSNGQVKSTLSSHCTTSNKNGKTVATCKSYTTIPTDIENPNGVQVLDMRAGNSLQILKTGGLADSKLKSLHTLYLQNCSIHQIELGAFNEGESLVHLDLSNNKIDVLDARIFATLPRLLNLELQNNPIHRFTDGTVFPPLNSLASLDFSGCQLKEMPTRFLGNLGNLKKLSLHSNQFKHLDWRVFQNLPLLTTLTLADNPWVCDCHVKFLKEHLEKRGYTTEFNKATCSSVGNKESNYARLTWDKVPIEEMICAPKVQKVHFESYDDGIKISDQTETERESNADGSEKVKPGQTVFFHCEYSGYPEPEITWLKDDKLIETNNGNGKRSRRAVPEDEPAATIKDGNGDNEKPIRRADESFTTPAPVPPKPKSASQQPKVEFEERVPASQEKTNLKYTQLFILRRIEGKDNGTYSCRVKYENDVDTKTVVLNVTVVSEWPFIGGLAGKKGVAIWIWILIGLLCVLLSVLIFLLTCLFWKRREKRKQEGFRKVMHEKFKDSNIDLGEFDKKAGSANSPQSQDQNRIDGATPLLDNRSESSTIPLSENHLHQKGPPLPDVAIGNATLIRNAQIFSPKPPPSHHVYSDEARKEFFARQISEPYLRPGSAMSLSRPAGMNAAQRRYIFANQVYQSEPVPADQENLYAVPHQFPRSGSAMSVSALPEYDLRRQMFLRQYAQPQSQYATTARLSGRGRLQSTSSEPPPEHNANSWQYSTLPRRPIRLQNWSRPASPTNSTCSTYSTLSWRPNIDPRTGVISDGMGARNTALGGSSTSVNKIPDLSGSIIGGDGDGLESMNRAMLTPSGGGKIKTMRNPRYGHSRTPSSLTRGHNDFFSFEPIQEIESSECASTANLDRVGGRQTPSGAPYSTQSLARGEPRYKRKKPPPISMIPANLKTPSRAFDHLKGRSISPALRNSVVNGDQPKEENSVNTNVVATPNGSANQTNLVNGTTNNANTSSIPVPVLESPIDDEVDVVILPKSSSKAPPPPPPPKPKRSGNQVEEELSTKQDDGEESEKSTTASDGTVV